MATSKSLLMVTVLASMTFFCSCATIPTSSNAPLSVLQSISSAKTVSVRYSGDRVFSKEAIDVAHRLLTNRGYFVSKSGERFDSELLISARISSSVQRTGYVPAASTSFGQLNNLSSGNVAVGNKTYVLKGTLQLSTQDGAKVRDFWTGQCNQSGDMITLLTSDNKQLKRNLLIQSLEENLTKMFDHCLTATDKTQLPTPAE